MKPVITVVDSKPDAVDADILVLGVYADGSMPPATSSADATTDRAISKFLAPGDMGEKPGGTLLLPVSIGNKMRRLLLVNLGGPGSWGESAFFKALSGAGAALANMSTGRAAVALPLTEVPGRTLAWQIRQASCRLADAFYRFDFPSISPKPDRGVSAIEILLEHTTDFTEAKHALGQGLATAEGMALAKTLGNLPANVCTPEYLAQTARELSSTHGLDVEVLECDEIERLGMRALLSVGKASSNPCRFIVMRHKGKEPDARPVVLVGKGITFDTGGISLKPGKDMDEMKYDMSGAGAVFGVMLAAAAMQLPLHLIGLVPAAENMPGGNATRPGDVIRSMSGQTIEILNTDAEGRLILCDALTYAERFQPECVIDLATLTGACVIALGVHVSGLFSNDDQLANDLLEAGVASGDRAWRLPLGEEYDEQLQSNFADMANVGGREAGAVTAACFLARFTKSYRWAHLDIAGTANTSGKNKGSTGRPLPLLVEYLLQHAQSSKTL